MNNQLNGNESVVLQLLGQIQDQLKQWPEFSTTLEDSDLFYGDLSVLNRLIAESPTETIRFYLAGISTMRIAASAITTR